MLFMPATNDRALRKAPTLPADTIIVDLEDAVHPAQRESARDRVRDLTSQFEFGEREVLVRINALATDQWMLDIQAFADSGLDGIVVPKVEHVADLQRLTDQLDTCASGRTPVLVIMIETPMGVINAVDLCAFEGVDAVLVGTADLSAAMGLGDTPERHGLQFALNQVVLAAKAADVAVIDGVFMDVRDQSALAAECTQGRAMGFDGKTLIHPAQLSITNQIFSPTDTAVDRANGIVEAWKSAQDSGEAVCLYNDRLVEHLHVRAAEHLLAVADAVREREQYYAS